MIKNQLKEVSEKISNIENTSGTNAKYALIKKYHEEGSLLVDVLSFIYDKTIKTGLSDKKFDKVIKNALYDSIDFQSITEYMNWLKEKPSKKDEDIAVVQSFTNTYNEYEPLIRAISTKKLSIGVAAKGLNKALGEQMVEDFKVMLAKKYQDYKDRITDKLAISLKMDGVRVIAEVFEDKVIFKTRKGNIIDGMFELEKECLRVLPVGNVYDGELEISGDFENSRARFRATQSLVAKKNIEKSGLVFTMFDYVPSENFYADNFDKPYRVRKWSIDDWAKKGESDIVKSVKTLYITDGTGEDDDKITELFNEVVAKGLEGLIANTMEGLYRRKRVSDVLKIKEFKTIDLKITGFKEGEGEFKGMLGSFIVSFKGNDVNVSGKLTQELRKEIWENQEAYLGKIIEISYFEVSKDKNGKESLCFPIFECVRFDKSSESEY